jgi:nicotinamide mononucleotide transporter
MTVWVMPDRERVVMTVLFNAWGYDVTLLEAASVVFAIIGIALGIKGTRWAWPFYFLGSFLYAWLFVEFDLFASAAMQLIFMAAAVWGWFTWGQEGVREPGRLPNTQRMGLALSVVVMWAALAPLLQMIGGAATWGDAFMLVGSLAAQLLMVFEKVEAWPSWVVVNVVGTVFYATQGLYFTSLFYGLLIVMALTGWRAWSQRAATVELSRGVQVSA